MRTISLLALFASLLHLAGCAASNGILPVESPYRDLSTLAKGDILHVATGRLLSEAELMDYVSRFSVIYVGESHDSVDDHAVQLALLKALQERFPGKVAVGMEMLKRSSQEEVDQFVRGEMSDKEFQRVWAKNWNDYSYYRDIVSYARDNRIPIVALNVEDDLKKAFREKGIEALPAEQAKEIDMDDPYHRAFAEGMMGGHAKGAKDPDLFYRVQVLWDETMAQTAAEYLKSPDGQGRHLLVFAGGNHIRYGIGIPRRVFRRVPLPYVLVNPYVNSTLVQVPEEKQMEVEVPSLPMPSADVHWSVDYRDLESQRVRLGVQIEEVDKKGVRVAGVVPESPASKAGIQKDDLIVSVDGVEVKEIFDLTYQVGLHKIGDVGPVEVLRGEKRLTFQVTYDVLKHGGK